MEQVKTSCSGCTMMKAERHTDWNGALCIYTPTVFDLSIDSLLKVAECAVKALGADTLNMRVHTDTLRNVEVEIVIGSRKMYSGYGATFQPALIEAVRMAIRCHR